MSVSSPKRFWDIGWEDIQVMRGTSDPDEEPVYEFRGNSIEEFPDVGERTFSWVIIGPCPVAKFHLETISFVSRTQR